MLRNIAFIADRETRSFLRDPEIYFYAFAMPVAFMYFIGTVTSQLGGGAGASRDPIAVVVPADAGFLADELVRRLEQNKFAVERPETPDAAERFARRLVVPERFTDRVLEGEKCVVKLVRKEEGLAADYDRFRVSRAVYTVLADLVACADAEDRPDPAAFRRLAEMPRSVTFEVASAGKREKVPTGFEQAVPGIMIMFVMLALLSSGGVSLVVDRQQGLLKRLASTPISRGEVFAGKWLGRLALGAVQLAFSMVAGTLLFGMDWGPDLPMIVAVLAAWARWRRRLGCCWATSCGARGRRSGSRSWPPTSFRPWGASGGRSRLPPPGCRSWRCACPTAGRWTPCTSSSASARGGQRPAPPRRPIRRHRRRRLARRTHLPLPLTPF